ncbi:MAG: hypothetical protein GY924_07435 [Planctomycetaceae bacterium]|nr:hypothetical protein [Planctomycetaceae bacterium]
MAETTLGYCSLPVNKNRYLPGAYRKPWLATGGSSSQVTSTGGKGDPPRGDQRLHLVVVRLLVE